MDLLNQATNALLPSRNAGVENKTLSCVSYTIQPDVNTYITALDPYLWGIWSCAVVVCLAICVVFATTVRSAVSYWEAHRASLITVLAVYPLVGLSSLVVVLVPRARVLSEALSQQAVMTAMYHLFCLTLAECGGQAKILCGAAIEPRSLETRTPPCCCWPCCVLPRPRIDRRSISWLRYLVLQMPIIQGLLYIIILVLWSEDADLYSKSFMFVQPLIIASILTGVWAMIMTLKMAEGNGVQMRPKFLALQLALLIVKLQCGIAKFLPEMFTLPCIVLLNPIVVVHLIQNSLMMVEMLLLSIWAWKLYSTPALPTKVQQVVVSAIEESAKHSPDGSPYNNNSDSK